MFDASLVYGLLIQIEDALNRVTRRFHGIETPDDFSNSEMGEAMLESISMLLLGIGENLKQIDYVTSGELLQRYPEVDWKGAKGLRDVLAHHYFDVDEEQIFSICKHRIPMMVSVVKRMVKDCEKSIDA